MNTEFGEKLRTAMDSIESLTWKTKEGNAVKLMSESEDNIRKYYTHCHNMLYNTNQYSPGKYEIRKNIAKT